MPGVGKTTLAARAARAAAGRYPDGTFYLNLHSHDPQRPPLDPAEALLPPAPDAVCAGRADTEARGRRAALWRAHLNRRQAVVILDDAAGRRPDPAAAAGVRPTA